MWHRICSLLIQAETSSQNYFDLPHFHFTASKYRYLEFQEKDAHYPNNISNLSIPPFQMYQHGLRRSPRPYNQTFEKKSIHLKHIETTVWLQEAIDIQAEGEVVEFEIRSLKILQTIHLS